MIWALLLALLAVAAIFAVYRVASARQAEAYIRAATADRRQLVELARGRGPAEVDRALPRQSLGQGAITPRARTLVRRRLWPEVAWLLSQEAVQQWLESGGGETHQSMFAVHANMDALGLAGVIANAQAYEAMPPSARAWMEQLDDDAHLGGDMRTAFAEQLAAGGKDCKLQKLGMVQHPVVADVYGIGVGKGARVNRDPPSGNAGGRAPRALDKEWADYRRWLEDTEPGHANALNPGAIARQLGQLERDSGVTLSEEFKAFYALHNGQPWETGWVFPEGQWMPLDQVLEAYRQCLEDAGPLWERSWMPIIFDGGSSYVAHDQSGSGELRIVWFEDDEPEPLACGIAAWLAQLNRQAEQGNLRFDPGRGQPILD